jgi:hypothetical protein
LVDEEAVRRRRLVFGVRRLASAVFCSRRMLSLAGQASAELGRFLVEDDNILDEQDKLREFQFPKQQRRGSSGRKRRVELKLHPYRSLSLADVIIRHAPTAFCRG